MSNNANSNRDDDKFFPQRTEDDKPKAPGSFTQSFMGPGAGASASAAFESVTPKSPTPFTAQFGSTDAFAPMRDVVHSGSIPEARDKETQPPTGPSGSFTTMFGSKTAAGSPPSESLTEVTRVFDRSATPVPAPKELTPSGFTELFGSQRQAPSVPEPQKPPALVSPFESRTAGSKTPGFTELFKPQSQAVAPSIPAQLPVSPLSAQPGTGRFTELFKTESAAAAVKPAVAPTPFSTSGPSGFTELFRTPSAAPQPAAVPPITPSAPESAPGGFTQLFKGSVASAPPAPVTPKAAGEFTQMISGSALTTKPATTSPAAPGAGATRLFNGESIAPSMAPLPAGPSEYTRVVSVRQLQELQQSPPAANTAAPPVSAPQLTMPPIPQAVPSWQPPQVQQAPPVAWQPPQPVIPTTFPAPPAAPAPKAESKILTYLPLIIGLNVLFLIAVLLILLFALKR